MASGPSPIENQASQNNQQYQTQLTDSLNLGQGYIGQGIQGITGMQGNIQSYLNGLGSSPDALSFRNMINQTLNGGSTAMAGAGSASASQAQAYNLGMAGNSFASQFGANLGQFNLQQTNMQTVADKLSSTTDNPFSVLNSKAVEDSALQNASGMDALRAQLASQGLGSDSGVGAAALAALSNTNFKAINDANRQAAVQGAQFQQQGLSLAGNLYQQIAGLDLQRASTQGQLGLSGYQADISNAGRYDAVSQANAQLGTQASIANAGNQTQASIANAQARNSMQAAALQAQGNLFSTLNNSQLAGLGLQQQGYNSILGAGTSLYGAGLGGMGDYNKTLNTAAQNSAAGRGQFGGGIVNSIFNLAGIALPFLL